VRYHYLLASTVVVSGLVSPGCSERQPSPIAVDARAAIDHEPNLAKLRSSPYYHASRTNRPEGAMAGPVYAKRP
jgi:hypothetical protein